MSVSKAKMSIATELLRRGAAMIKEPCPKCGSIQMKYGGRTLCINCDDLGEAAKAEPVTRGQAVSDLRELVLGKIREATGRLQGESDIEKEILVTDLLIRYLEVLDRLGKLPEAE